jgi:hypothetical protein
MEMKKLLATGIIFLFIGVAVAPSINSTVVKTSDDLVEVTSQACGIQGFGNTTVKLTKEQYQNLESYLVDFRARLNQTSTREEAIPIFKDAVVELSKYGLLPKGISVQRIQDIVTGRNIPKRINHLLGKNVQRINATNICALVYANGKIEPTGMGNMNLLLLWLAMGPWSYKIYNSFLYLLLYAYSQIKPFTCSIFVSLYSAQVYSIGLKGIKHGDNISEDLEGFIGLQIITKYNFWRGLPESGIYIGWTWLV